MATFDIVAIEVVLLDLVTCLGGLVNIVIQSHSHFAADAAGMCVLCMEQFEDYDMVEGYFGLYRVLQHAAGGTNWRYRQQQG